MQHARLHRGLFKRLTSPAATFDFLGGSLPAGATLTRASSAWYFDSSLVLTGAAVDEARFTYSTSTGVLAGLLVEPAATNSSPNSAATGGVDGSPGTAATNWSITAISSGLTRTLSFGTDNGIGYMDIRLAGTPAATSSVAISSSSLTGIAATAGQTWIAKAHIKLIAGSLTNAPTNLACVERNSSGTFLANTTTGAFIVGQISGELRNQRFTVLRTLNNASTACVTGTVNISWTINVPIDLTIRVGNLEIVQEPTATSTIVSSSVAVTRAADVLALALSDGIYSIDIFRAAGITTLQGVVVSGGSYTVPTSGSPIQVIVAKRTG